MNSDPYPEKTSHLIFERRYQFYVSFSKRKEQRKCSLRTLQRKSSSAFQEVPDPTFSEKILGDRVAVIPSEGKIYAPTDGEIAMVFDTLHAITLTKQLRNRNPDPHRPGYGYTKGRTVYRTRCSRRSGQKRRSSDGCRSGQDHRSRIEHSHSGTDLQYR